MTDRPAQAANPFSLTLTACVAVAFVAAAVLALLAWQQGQRYVEDVVSIATMWIVADLLLTVAIVAGVGAAVLGGVTVAAAESRLTRASISAGVWG